MLRCCGFTFFDCGICKIYSCFCCPCFCKDKKPEIEEEVIKVVEKPKEETPTPGNDKKEKKD